MPRSKKDVAENIRSSVVSPDVKVNQRVADVKSNIDVAKTVQSVAVHIKTLTDQEKEFFEKLLKGVAEIPKNNEEFQRYQKRLYQDLIKTTAIIKEAAEKESDVKKKEELVKAAQQMEQKGKQLEVETDEGPRSFKESMAQRHFGLAPQRVRKEGFFKTLKSTIKEGIIPQNEERFSSAVDLERQASSLKPEQFKPETEKQNTKKTPGDVFSKLLTEVTTIRKVVEGRIKFDPNSKGNKYYELGEKGKKRSISSAEIREAGAGLYTKKEQKEMGMEDVPKKAKVTKKKQSTKKEEPTSLFDKYKQNPDFEKIAQQELEDNPYVNVSPEEREKALSLMPVDAKNTNVTKKIRPAKVKKISLQEKQDAEILAVENKYLEKEKDSKRTQEQKDKDLQDYVKEREKVEARHKKQKEKLVNKKQETEGQDTEDEQNENVDRDITAATTQKDEARFLSSGVDTETDVKPEEKEKEKQDTGAGGGAGSALMDIGSSFLRRGGGRLSRGAKGAGRLLKGGTRGTARALNAGRGLLTKGAGKGLLRGGLRAAGRFARFAGPAGLAIGAGMGIYDSFKGFTADPNATTGDKLKNAGSSLVSGLTFGLLGKSSDEIKANAETRQAEMAEAGVMPQQMPTSAVMPQQMPAAPALATTAKLEATQQRVASQKIDQGTMTTQNQQPPVVNNITNNNYQGGKGKSDSSIEKVMPPVRPTDTTFLRYQDKRMTRVL